MKMRIFLLKVLLLFVQAVNPWLADPLYHFGHLCLALSFGIMRFGQQKLVVFLICYFLALELVTERFIFKRDKRKKIHQEGKEVIQMIKEEIKNVSD